MLLPSLTPPHPVTGQEHHTPPVSSVGRAECHSPQGRRSKGSASSWRRGRPSDGQRTAIDWYRTEAHRLLSDRPRTQTGWPGERKRIPGIWHTNYGCIVQWCGWACKVSAYPSCAGLVSFRQLAHLRVLSLLAHLLVPLGLLGYAGDIWTAAYALTHKGELKTIKYLSWNLGQVIMGLMKEQLRDNNTQYAGLVLGRGLSVCLPWATDTTGYIPPQYYCDRCPGSVGAIGEIFDWPPTPKVFTEHICPTLIKNHF